MPDNGSPAHFEVAVIGAGQAGLAIGCLLARQGRRFVILDGADSIGAAWRDRWDSLVLFTPRRYDSLPGSPSPVTRTATRRATRSSHTSSSTPSTFELPVELDSAVRSLTKNGRAFELELDDRTHRGRPGRDRNRAVPDAAGAELRQPARSLRCSRSTALDYRRPSDLPDGTVLVVGGGNTGYQIAAELSATHEVHLAIGARQTPLPQKLARPRPVLVAREDQAAEHAGRLATRAEAAAAGTR